MECSLFEYHNIKSALCIGRDDVSIEILIREAVESRKDHSFLSAGVP